MMENTEYKKREWNWDTTKKKKLCMSLRRKRETYDGKSMVENLGKTFFSGKEGLSKCTEDVTTMMQFA